MTRPYQSKECLNGIRNDEIFQYQSENIVGGHNAAHFTCPKGPTQQKNDIGMAVGIPQPLVQPPPIDTSNNSNDKNKQITSSELVLSASQERSLSVKLIQRMQYNTTSISTPAPKGSTEDNFPHSPSSIDICLLYLSIMCTGFLQ